MYDEALKEQFIFSLDKIGRQQIARMMFNRIEYAEVEWGADICTRSKKEIAPVVEQLVGVRRSSKSAMFPILQAYGKWCLEHQIAGATDALVNLGEPGVNKLKKSMVPNPSVLQHYLNSVCDPESDETIDLIYRCFFWLAYIGVPEDDIVYIQTKDVDIKNKRVVYNGEEYPIYEEAIEAFDKCSSLDIFTFINANYETKRARYDGDLLLRGYRSPPSLATLRVQASKLTRAQKYRDKIDPARTDNSLDIDISYFRTRLSGLFYRAYEHEKQGVEVEFGNEADMLMSGKEYNFEHDKGRTLETHKRKLAREYKDDYLRWKEAFGLN